MKKEDNKIKTSLEERAKRAGKVEKAFLETAPMRFIFDDRSYKDAEITSIENYEIYLSTDPNAAIKKQRLTIVFQQSDFPTLKRENAILYRKEVKELNLKNINSFKARQIKGIHKIKRGDITKFVTRSGLVLKGKVKDNTCFSFVIETFGCLILLYKHALYAVKSESNNDKETNERKIHRFNNQRLF